MSYRAQRMLVALAVDAALGDPPNALHPVVAMGHWITLGERLAPGGAGRRLLWGGGWTLSGLALSATIAASVPRNLLLHGGAASLLLSYRALDHAVGMVQAALVEGDFESARRLLSWHLVSRPTAELSAPDVAAAAIESLAENLSDSVVAPLCWYAAGGLPALAAYRFSNTADAMWGYRDERYEHLGKVAARIDDILNWAPARATALVIVLAAQLTNGRGRATWSVARRDASNTASPNAGWPMASVAGALDTTLVKIGQYRLGHGDRSPDAAMIMEARSIVRCAVFIVVVLILLVSTAGDRSYPLHRAR
ncbi:MAG TPA: adenosylcobinamide-phosphate synthase CbiB [Herpetosiphonaceae bacterium]|nr:adenosylcobinamide-phosphate synthase CbiB [Herpetosiphonaceae bacterium]